MTFKRIFLLCCLPSILFFNSCSTETNIQEAELEELSNVETLNILRVDVGDDSFSADRVNVNLQGSLINIVGTEIETDRSVFLTFVLKGDLQILGDSARNPDSNVAGYLLNTEGIGYLTNAVDGIVGEIKITELDTEKNLISGEFFFTAYNQDFQPIQLKNGIFENVSFER